MSCEEVRWSASVPVVFGASSSLTTWEPTLVTSWWPTSVAPVAFAGPAAAELVDEADGDEQEHGERQVDADAAAELGEGEGGEAESGGDPGDGCHGEGG